MFKVQDYLILGAAFFSFLLSVSLWFGVFGPASKEAGAPHPLPYIMKNIGNFRMLMWIPMVLAVWCALGALVAVPFLLFAVGGAVEGAKGSSVMFRLMMLPAAVVLWPTILRRWIAPRTGARHA